MKQPQTPPSAAGIRNAPYVGYVVLYIGLLMFILCTRIAPAHGASQLSDTQNKHLVEQGVALYEQKDLDGAQKTLQRAEVLFPDNFAVPYYLGLIHLGKDQRKEAISQWKRYLSLDPNSENAMQIRKLLTLLLCREAAENARTALANEAKLMGAETGGNALAVTAFQNMGSSNLSPLGKGMTAMLIADLSNVPNLHVVERIELQALLQEMKMGASGLVEVQTAPKIGRLLKARYVSTGSFADITKGQIEIAGITIDASDEKPVGSQQASGAIDVFFILEKQIACGILKSIDRDCNTAPKNFHKMHTKSLPAFVAFSEGLDCFDQRQYDDARKKFQQALKKDPEFDLARKAFAATPSSKMLLWNTSQMVASASASGIPSAAAGSATASKAKAGSTPKKVEVGSATAIKTKTGSATATKAEAGSTTAAKTKTGSATATKTEVGSTTATNAEARSTAATEVKADSAPSKINEGTTTNRTTESGAATVDTAGTDSTAVDTTAPEETGLSTKTYAIAGGVVAVAGVLALAGGGGGGGGGGDSAVPQGADVTSLTGDWSGDFNERASGATGLVSLQLSQDENRLSGTGSFSGTECLSSININGTISGQTVAMDISGGSGSAARFEGTYTRPTMSGTLHFTSGDCEGRVFEMSSELLSSAVVIW